MGSQLPAFQLRHCVILKSWDVALAADFLRVGKQAKQLMVRKHLLTGELNNAFELYIAILNLVPRYELVQTADDAIVPRILLLIRRLQPQQIREDLLVVPDLTVDLSHPHRQQQLFIQSLYLCTQLLHGLLLGSASGL